MQAERVAAVADVEHGEGVAQRVRRHPNALDARLLAVAQDQLADLAAANLLPGLTEKELTSLDRPLGARLRVDQQRLAGLGREGHGALLAALAHDGHGAVEPVHAVKVATSIVKNMQEGKLVEAVAIGAAAVNQALKAVAIARGLVAPCGWDLVVSPGFRDLMIEGETKTGLVLAMLRR